MESCSNEVAVITGDDTGMGRYLARLLTRAGGNIAACEINKNSLAETVAMLKD